jgi:glucosamine kinase
MNITVGVDGGQSRIRLRVSGDTDVKSSPGVSHLESPTAATVAEVVAGLLNGRVERISRLVAGLTTIPAAAEERLALATHLAEATGAHEVWVAGDEVTCHAGAFAGATGVVLSVGTGVACLALDGASGAHRTFDGAGYLVGDEGGGFWLGRHGVRAALAAREGRGPETSLTDAVSAEIGPIEMVAALLHSTARAVDTIAQLARVVLAEAAAGDEVAEAILSEATARLVTTASAGVRFLSSTPEVTMALGGRLLREGQNLAAAVTARLEATFPNLKISLAKGSSLDGACALAEWAAPGPYETLLSIHRSQP